MSVTTNNETILMQLKFLLLALVLSISGTVGFAQSKKKQIKHLKFKLDSINQVLTSERNTNSNRDIELNKTIQKLEVKNSSIEQRLKESESEINKKNEILKDENRKILNLEQEINSLLDSLEKTQRKNKTQFNLLENFEINISDNDLIKLIKARITELPQEFTNEINLNSNKDNLIQGKQAFEHNGEKQCIVLLGIPNEDDCHFCSGINFLGHLIYAGNSWVLHSIKICDLSNQWGNYADLDGIYLAGKKNIAIIVSGAESGQGTTVGVRKLYLLHRDHFIEAYYGYSIENNTGEVDVNDPSYYDHEYEISFKDTGNDFFDLIETFKSRGKYVSEKIYHFNEQTMKYEN
jgi:hypothetical protein